MPKICEFIFYSLTYGNFCSIIRDGQIFIKLDGEETIPTIRKIETIVTKEQFESMSYKVGE